LGSPEWGEELVCWVK